MLKVTDLGMKYGAIEALKGISLEVKPGELVALIGSNGAGKTTLMRVISGLFAPSTGDIEFDGGSLMGVRPHTRVAMGIGHVPEGRHVFGDQSVRHNLELGAYGRNSSRSEMHDDTDRMFQIFPRLKERANQSAGTLSGGEQQMVAIARALMGRPKLLLLDEPSLGLAPLIVREIFMLIGSLKSQGVTILLVEQLANLALSIADRAYVLETGSIILEGTAAALLSDKRVREAYLGAGT